jgi:tetratricopeptide (TPR) repeat protein
MNMQIIMIPLLCLTTQLSTAESAADLIKQGDACDARLETSEALGCYLKAEEILPNDAELQIKIAKQYGESMVDAPSAKEKRALGERALTHAKRALVLAPDLCDSHLAVAICYGRLLDVVGVRTKVEYSRLVKQHGDKAVAIDPGSDYAWHMLGRWHQAVSTTNQVLLGAVKLVYGGLPDSSLEKAAECFAAAERLAPGRVAHPIELGRTFAMQGKSKEAREAIERGMALPNSERDDPDTKARGEATLKKLGPSD